MRISNKNITLIDNYYCPASGIKGVQGTIPNDQFQISIDNAICCLNYTDDGKYRTCGQLCPNCIVKEGILSFIKRIYKKNK